MSNHHEIGFKKFLAEEKHLAHMVLQRAKKYGSKTALCHKPYGSWLSISWEQFGHQARQVAAALWEVGVRPTELVAIFSQNRAEWSIVDIGIQILRAASVPIYATNSLEETRYIVNHAEIKVMFVNDQAQYDKALALLAPATGLHKIVVFDKRVTLKNDTTSQYFEDFIKNGPSFASKVDEILATASSEDLATIIYTSGTTGQPKGVMLTHKNFLAMVYAAGFPLPLAENEVSISWLPLSHVFERSWTYFVFCRGVENHYCLQPKEVLEHIAEVRPHYMTSVPRLWEKVYLNIWNKVNQGSKSKQKIFHWALSVGKKYYTHKVQHQPACLGLKFKHFLAKQLVLGKVQNLVGGRCKNFNCGGAPVAGHISEFFFNAGIMLAQGYGMTEFFPICVTNPQHIKHGTCGPIVPLAEIRISEEGEIQAKGPTCMRGYYKDEDATKAIMTTDGWLKTGDQGIIDKDGYIVITDRIKELIITSGGKNISPLKIESMLKENLFIEQAVAIGNNRPYISALIVPSFATLESYAAGCGLPIMNKEQLVAHPLIFRHLEQIVKECCKELSPFEQVKSFALLSRDLTQELGEMTATAKLKRRVIDSHFKETIDGLYS